MCDHNAGAVSFRRSHSGTAVVLLATNPCVTRCNCVDDSWHMHMSLQRLGVRRFRMAQGPATSCRGFARHPLQASASLRRGRRHAQQPPCWCVPLPARAVAVGSPAAVGACWSLGPTGTPGAAEMRARGGGKLQEASMVAAPTTGSLARSATGVHVESTSGGPTGTMPLAAVATACSPGSSHAVSWNCSGLGQTFTTASSFF